MPEFITSSFIINLLLFCLGFYVLIKGSDIFIDAAAAIARIWKVPELVIGLTLVSIGTSLPEWASSVYAASQGSHGFVIGNVVGSCTTNIALVLGIAVVIGGGLAFPHKLMNRDALLMNIIFAVTLICFGIGMYATPEQSIWGNRIIGVLFLLASIGYCYYLFKHPDELNEEIPETHSEPKNFTSTLKAFMLLFVGFVMIFAGSKLLVDNVVWMARELNIPEIIIASTVVAFGTSVPELAVTLGGVLKGRNDIAIGNIIGSCIFNILLIFGTAAIITPLDIHGGEWISILFMMVSGVVLFITMKTHHKIVRWEGWILLFIYLAFVGWICWPLISGETELTLPQTNNETIPDSVFTLQNTTQ